MAKTKTVPSKKSIEKLKAYKFEEDAERDRKDLLNEFEDLHEILVSQEEKLQNIYDLESSLKVMALAVGAIASDFSDTNEELFHKFRDLKAVVSTDSNTEY
jgi:hypothetical protein